MTNAFSLRAETSFYWVPYHNMVLQSTHFYNRSRQHGVWHACSPAFNQDTGIALSPQFARSLTAWRRAFGSSRSIACRSRKRSSGRKLRWIGTLALGVLSTRFGPLRTRGPSHASQPLEEPYATDRWKKREPTSPRQVAPARGVPLRARGWHDGARGCARAARDARGAHWHPERPGRSGPRGGTSGHRF